VNLAARLTGLANAGETVVSSIVRDTLTDGIDGEVSDLGMCHLKHVTQPIRAWLVQPRKVVELGAQPKTWADLRPGVAILPLDSQGKSSPVLKTVSSLIADGLAHALGPCAELRVLHRLTTDSLTTQGTSEGPDLRSLGCTVVWQGSVESLGARFQIRLHAIESNTGRVLTSGEWLLSFAELRDSQGEFFSEIARLTLQALEIHSAVRSGYALLANLHSSQLMFDAIRATRATDFRQFKLARTYLEALIERHPRNPQPMAALADWFTCSVAVAQSDQPHKSYQLAMQWSARSIDTGQEYALAWANRALAQMQLGEHVAAQDSLDRALTLDRSLPQAHLNSALLASFTGDGARAILHAQQAIAVSPLDPHRYYFEALLAGAYLSAGDYQNAKVQAEKSIRTDSLHAPTHRVLTIAQWMLGDQIGARHAALSLLRIAPHYTVSMFLSRHQHAASQLVLEFAKALAGAGIPAGNAAR
jgi:tetratricopeptide (TPR) repeat protein